MIRVERPQFSPEDLFRDRHRNNADILDRICATYEDKTKSIADFKAAISGLNDRLILTYGIATANYEGEFDMVVEGKGTLHVKFYSSGFMELSVI